MPQRAASEVGANVRRILVEDLSEGVNFGVRWFAVDRWYHGVFKALDDLIKRGRHHGGGGRTN